MPADERREVCHWGAELKGGLVFASANQFIRSAVSESKILQISRNGVGTLLCNDEEIFDAFDGAYGGDHASNAPQGIDSGGMPIPICLTISQDERLLSW